MFLPVSASSQWPFAERCHVDEDAAKTVLSDPLGLALLSFLKYIGMS